MSSEQPIQEEFIEQMNAIGRALDETFNGPFCRREDKKVGFALLIFKFGEDGDRTNYISNAQREEMLLSMKEFIARAEGRISDEENMQ